MAVFGGKGRNLVGNQFFNLVKSRHCKGMGDFPVCR
jgi:hypothetical protein